MAAYDISVYSTVGEGASRQAFRTNITAATFQTGEPVILVGNLLADGESGGGGVDPVAILGIAAESAVSRGSHMAALEIEDTVRLVEMADAQNKLFVARYFATGGAGVHVTPTFAAVAGIPGNLVYNAGTDTWAFDTGAANLNCVGVDVLDADGMRLGNDLVQHGAGATVLFTFI